MVLTTVTVQVNPVVAPCGDAATLLHWSMVKVAAFATEAGRANSATEKAPVSTISAATDATPKRTREALRAYLGNFMVDPFEGLTWC